MFLERLEFNVSVDPVGRPGSMPLDRNSYHGFFGALGRWDMALGIDLRV